MKGDLSASAALIYTTISLVIILLFIVAMSPEEQAENTYLGQPGGVSMRLYSDYDFLSFIRSPEKGNLVFLGGKSIIKSLDGKENAYDLMPTAAMYPLYISNTQSCPQDSGNPIPFGSATLEMELNIQKLDDYLRNTYAESFSSKKSYLESEEILKNIWINVCWDNGKNCYGYDSDSKTGLAGDGIRLDELKKNRCFEVSSSPRKIKCTFNLDPIVEKCCPSSLYIEANITAEVNTDNGDGFSKKRTISPIPLRPTLIYYVDSSNKDYLFSEIDNSLGACFKTPSAEKKNPIEGISIYPCRAIVPDESTLKSLSDKITGPKEEPINFGDCIGGSAKEVDGYKLISPEFGWMCKKTSSGAYYLFNPYAFCKLDGTELTSSPEIGYLQSRFPSGSSQVLFVTTSTEVSWDKAKTEIDKAYGLG